MPCSASGCRHDPRLLYWNCWAYIPHSLRCLPTACQTDSYLPGHTSLPLCICRYSSSIPLVVGGWVGLSGWLYTEMVCWRMVTHLSTNRARCGVTLLMRATPLRVVWTSAAQNKSRRHSIERIPLSQYASSTDSPLPSNRHHLSEQ